MSPVSTRQKPAASAPRNSLFSNNTTARRSAPSGPAGSGSRVSSEGSVDAGENSRIAPRPVAGAAKPEAEILFQDYFKSVGPRTYAAQLKRAGNGNHFLVLTEGKRDDKTGEIRKTRLFVFSEDFAAFFKMLHETACHIRQNPVPDEVRRKREKFWGRQDKLSKR